MGKLDREKEEISWIKFWIGVSVAAIMGMVSWLVNHYENGNFLIIFLDIVTIVGLAGVIIKLNRMGLQKIKDLEELE